MRPAPLQPFELDVPGDPSQAAFWIVAACVVPGSEVVVDDVYLGPARPAFLDVLRRMGADVEQTGGGARCQRAVLAATARHRGRRREIAGLIDEIPVLAVAAAVAEGDTIFGDAGELRVKESDRVATTTAGLAAPRRRAPRPRDDGLVVDRATRLRGRATAQRTATTASPWPLAVAGLAAEGTTTIDGWEAVATSYPGFEA